jgi:hypothetical protein
MDLHEDIVPRAIAIIEIAETDQDYTTIFIHGDPVASEWGQRGAGGSSWKMARPMIKTQYKHNGQMRDAVKPTDDTPWTLFVDHVYRALEDIVPLDQPHNAPTSIDPNYDVRSDERFGRQVRESNEDADEYDKYGPLGYSKTDRFQKGLKSGEDDTADMYTMKIGVMSLGATVAEAAASLLETLEFNAPSWLKFSIDSTNAIYALADSDDMGYDGVGELDLRDFETDDKDAAGVRNPGNRVLDTKGMSPEDIRDEVRKAHTDWESEVDKRKRTGLESDDDLDDLAGPSDEELASLEEGRKLCGDPDVYASALLLSGFTPRTVSKILGSQGLKTSMSEEEMSEIRAFHSAVITESLADRVSKAHRAIRTGIIARNGMLREDAVERYRRTLFTKRFASDLLQQKDAYYLEDLAEDTAFRQAILATILTADVSEVAGQEIDEGTARQIVDSLNDQELNAIRSNIEEVKGGGI